MNLIQRLDRIAARADELRAMLSEVMGGEAYVKASRELSELEPVVARIDDLRAAEQARREAEAMMADPEMKELAEAELYDLKDRIPALEHELRIALLPKDEADERSAILEIRPAAGGDEAGLFAAQLYGMYQKYAGTQGWRFEVLEYGDTELGGLKEGIAEITGRNVFARLKYESGVHRVQRVPATESQGRIHTSTVTVAVLPEAEEVDVQVDEGDLRIDVYRASGAGGQHVNKTESAVRITHLPTGIAVASQSERSQHQNRAICWDMLKARLYEIELQRKKDETGAFVGEKKEIGWGHQIRSYVLQPYQLVKDLRTGVESRTPQDVLDGDLDPFMAAALAQEVGGKPREKIEDIE